MTVEPPMYEERRRTPDRRQGGRRAEDRLRFFRNAAAAAVAICGGLVLIYLFFGAVGAVDFTEAVVATSVAVAMAAIWLGVYWYRRRALDAKPRGPRALDRERRGF